MLNCWRQASRTERVANVLAATAAAAILLLIPCAALLPMGRSWHEALAAMSFCLLVAIAVTLPMAAICAASALWLDTRD